MQKNSERRRVSSEYDDFRNSTVQCLRGLVGSLPFPRLANSSFVDAPQSINLLELPVVTRLLHKVENLLRESLVSLRPSCGLVVRHGGGGSRKPWVHCLARP